MRPILLVIDPPDVEMISTRKLILESAKYNVLTATTAEEAIEIANRVPISAAVIHERIFNDDTGKVSKEIKTLRPTVPLWVISPQPHTIPAADRVLSSFDPLELVRIAQQTLGDPVDPKTGKTRTDVTNSQI